MTDTFPRIDATELSRQWDAMHQAYFPDYHERWKHVITSLASLSIPPQHILDIGCGVGSLTETLARGLPNAAVVGVDADARLIALANHVHASRGVEFHALRFGPNAIRSWHSRPQFDAVVSSALMHYFNAQQLHSVLESCRSVLAPGGVVVTAETFAADLAAPPPESNPWREWWDRAQTLPEFASSTDLSDTSEAPDTPLTRESFIHALDTAQFTVTDEKVTSSGGRVIVAQLRSG